MKHYSDDEIAAAAAGLAHDEVLEHLWSCPGCSRRVRENEDIESLLGIREAVFSLLHPQPHVLAAFLESDLPPGRRAAVRAHVETCPECREDVRAATEQAEEEKPVSEIQPLRVEIRQAHPLGRSEARRRVEALVAGFRAVFGDVTRGSVRLSSIWHGNSLDFSLAVRFLLGPRNIASGSIVVSDDSVTFRAELQPGIGIALTEDRIVDAVRTHLARILAPEKAESSPGTAMALVVDDEVVDAVRTHLARILEEPR